MFNEHEPMLLKDFERYFEKQFPKDKLYSHADNGYSHMRASLLKTSSTIPVAGNRLVLGSWQAIIFWEFDKRPRTREIIVTVLGE